MNDVTFDMTLNTQRQIDESLPATQASCKTAESGLQFLCLGRKLLRVLPGNLQQTIDDFLAG